MTEQSLPPRKKVLSDHFQKGKTFVAPFNHTVGEITGISWKDLLPELLWLGLMNKTLGLKQAVEVAVESVRLAETTNPKEGDRPIFCLTSAFSALSANHAKDLSAKFTTAGLKDSLKRSLFALTANYPECPFKFLFEEAELSAGATKDMDVLKRIVGLLLDRRGRDATLVQTTAICSASASGRILMKRGMAMGDFNAVLKYPNTERSKQVASLIRATTNMLSLPEARGSFSWSDYFWRRGFEISNCEAA